MNKDKPLETMEEQAARIQAMLPSPEEIMAMAQIEAHNDEIRMKRVARLAARKARKAKRQKKKKKR